MSDQRPRRLSLGARGEAHAERYLEAKGYRVLRCNYRAGRSGEIDLIAEDGETLVFIEVKTRRTRQFGTPQAAVDLRKQRQISRAALLFLQEQGWTDRPCRFDVIALLDDARRFSIEHIQNAFEFAGEIDYDKLER